VRAAQHLAEQLLVAQLQPTQVPPERAEGGVVLTAVVAGEQPVGFRENPLRELLVTHTAHGSGVHHGRRVDDADVLVAEQLRPDRVQPPAPTRLRLVERRQEPFERGRLNPGTMISTKPTQRPYRRVFSIVLKCAKYDERCSAGAKRSRPTPPATANIASMVSGVAAMSSSGSQMCS
jgi:hypothetical protein